ncbi:3-hydroxyacyl-CoA dehydrogenase type-2 [Ilyonectria sp. MPI-CAGE-AT-0026]|nr:3-hydroxyacyl-CoA dehydrogenase type-2 [Ilyonectria sp. MPI-CAGE-AT-0026]
MHQLDFSSSDLSNLAGQTVIVTGADRGIGASTAALFNSNGANVVLVDLPSAKDAAESLIKSFQHPKKSLFVPANILVWEGLVTVFKIALQRFSKVDVVVANAAIMESKPVLHVEVDEAGDPVESLEANRVIDVNLKGTLNTLRLGLHYLGQNKPSSTSFRGSIVFVTSTSGYFGSTGNAAYISSKHGVVGLIRASLRKAASLGINLNSVVPSYTPTHLTAGFGQSISNAGLNVNTLEGVASVAVNLASDQSAHGVACLVWGHYHRELERTQQDLLGNWLGDDLVASMTNFGQLMDSMGGYPLPQNKD